MKTCKDCIYMLLINSYTEDDGIRTYNGECRFFPDSVYVKSDYWCGQLKEKPARKEPRSQDELRAIAYVCGLSKSEIDNLIP